MDIGYLVSLLQIALVPAFAVFAKINFAGVTHSVTKSSCEVPLILLAT